MKVVDFQKHHEMYSNWLLGLKNLDDSTWFMPISEGKWSVAAIVSHLLFWDRHCISEKIPNFKEGSVITGYPDFQEYNQTAQEYAHSGVSKESLMNEIIAEREQYQTYLNGLKEEDLDISFEIGGHPITIGEFLKDFMSHDLHHQEQINKLLKPE